MGPETDSDKVITSSEAEELGRIATLETSPDQEIRELDERRSDNMRVRLLLLLATSRTAVEIRDYKANTLYWLDVPESANPLKYFHHPMAYVDEARVSIFIEGPAQPVA